MSVTATGTEDAAPLADDGASGRLGTARTLARDLEARRARARVRHNLFGAPAPPVKIGRYVVIKQIGAGGMGVVFSAFDPELDRKVAIKLLHAGREGEQERTRLVREARAMARLSHPNVVAVHDVGTDGDEVFVAMEYVDGSTLKAWLELEAADMAGQDRRIRTGWSRARGGPRGRYRAPRLQAGERPAR